MNIKALTASAAATVFRITESLAVACTYRQPGTVAYDAAAGAVTPNYTEQAVSGRFTIYEARETDSPARRQGERRVIVRRSELTLSPTLADTIVEGANVWQVLDIEAEPTDAVFAFVVKRSQP